MNAQNENPDGEHTGKRDGYIDIDTVKVKKLMNELGLSQEQVGKAMNASRSVVQRALKKWSIREHLLERLAKAVNTSPENLLRSSSYEERPQPKFETPIPNDWKLVEVVNLKTTTANGVIYCIAKLQHTIIEEKFSRGKFYEFGELPDGGLNALRERLKRHATVCERMSNAEGTRIARIYGIVRLMDDTAWWILDDWIEGATLNQSSHMNHRSPGGRSNISEQKFSLGWTSYMRIRLSFESSLQNEFIFLMTDCDAH